MNGLESKMLGLPLGSGDIVFALSVIKLLTVIFCCVVKLLVFLFTDLKGVFPDFSLY